MIKIILAISLLFISVPFIGNTRTVDVTTLSDQDKIYHRIGWCKALDNKHGSYLDRNKFDDFYDVLYNDDYFDKDVNNIVEKAFNDVEALLALDEYNTFMGVKTSMDKNKKELRWWNLAEKWLRECVIDMKQIVKDTYVPNFSYMKN